MVVDDDHDAADTTARLLTICGVDARACYSGTTALDTLATFPAEVCILDMSMPELQGWEVAMLIRLELKNPPYLAALTAYSDDAHRQLIENTGFDLHLIKPIEPAKLLHELSELVKRPRGKSG
ncbi:MAG: response regulator [Gemmataceae bacterium]|nr:response regulator [Gemmataceae bacterium]